MTLTLGRAPAIYNRRDQDDMRSALMREDARNQKLPIYMTRTLSGASSLTLQQWLLIQPINVKEFGATGDGTTDDSASFAAALAAVTSGGTIYIPPGTYRVNITVDKPVIWQGAGMGASIVRSYSSGGIVFKIVVDTGGWILQSVFNDLRICGASSTVTATGIQLGDATAADDQLAGRIECNRVNFIDLNYCVRKIYGNIGNTFNRCVFNNANYHMHAVDVDSGGVSMQGGVDVFQGMCHFDNAQLAVFYYDSELGGTGMFVSNDSIIEGNPGFVYFFKNFNSTAIHPAISINRTWHELNATASTVTIDAVAYTPPTFARFTNSRFVSITESALSTVTLVASTVVAKSCHYYTDFALTADSASAMINYDTHTDDTPAAMASAGLVGSIAGMDRTSGGFVTGISIPHPNKVSVAYNDNILESLPFVAVTNFSGSASINTTPAADGTCFDVAQDLSYTSAQTEVSGGATITADKYYVAMVTVKKISGVAPSLTCNNAVNLGTFGTISNTDWKTLAFTTKAASSGTVCLRCNPPASGTTVLRFGGYCLVEFDTLQEAVSFINAGVFPILTAANLRTAFTVKSGTGSVASGATTAVITHGLGLTPTAADISVVFTEQGTNDYGRWWVDTITSTQFTVNVSADPGASNLDFSWKAIV